MLPLRPLAVLFLACLAACAATPKLPTGESVGEPLVTMPAVKLSAVSADPEAFAERTVLVDATAEAVCLRAGCWMQIEESGVVAMVRWETGCGGLYEFPEAAVGRRVLIQGSVYPKQLTDEEFEHLTEEAAPGVTIERTGFELNASAVLIVDAGA